MNEPARDTVFALSSGRPPAAIAVVRMSGPRAGEALKALTGKNPPVPRHAAFVRVQDPETKAVIDEGLALFFPGPRSETGEDVAELQLHGGRAVVAATLAALGKLEGLRPAEAGEFTRRAFENGKLDLTAVEGLADLVMAETEGQRAQALRQMQGALGKRAESWRERLIRALALVEARIDFSDEADVPEDLVQPALTIVRELANEIEQALADGHRGERLREGLVVAIAGPPNAGKSTLLNRIARREAAIVSPYAGTTRDVIEVHLDLGGLPVTLLDTAGIRDTDDPVEMEGVRRARERAASADLVLWVVDASDATSAVAVPATARSAVAPGGDRPEPVSGLASAGCGEATGLESKTSAPGYRSRARPPSPSEVRRRAKSDDETATSPLLNLGSHLAEPPVWLIRNKIDLVEGDRRNESLSEQFGRNELGILSNGALNNIVNSSLEQKNEDNSDNIGYLFYISATAGEGLDALISALSRHAESFLAGAEPALVTRQRHRSALETALAALRRALDPELAGREDLLAEELHIASRALGRLTGRVDVEDILDVIFRDFCIGK
jgi:tRNA modification GTPase